MSDADELVRYCFDVVVPMDPDLSVLDGGVVEVSQGRIVYVGQPEDAPRNPGRTVRLGGLAMPGLVNTHAHTPMSLVRGAGDGLPLMRWLTEVMWPREGQMTPEDVAWGMRLGAAEMLRCGITTTCEMYLFEEAVVEGARDAGIRLVMTPAMISALHGEDFGTSQARLDELVAFHRTHHDPDGTVTVGLAPHSAYDLGIDRCAEIAAAAQDIDALLHLHLVETRDEGRELEAAHGGTSTTRLLAEAGVFDGRVLAAHAVWLDDEDLRLVAEHGVAVAHCPMSNMKLGSGVARVPELLAAGVTVGLATDGPASNDALDLWQELRMTPMLARVSRLDAAALGPADTLAMATHGGATALGLDGVGRLAVGQRADMIRLDIEDPAFVPVTRPEELVAHLAWSAGARHVTDVWVEGARVVEDGQCLTIDMERAVAEGHERGRRLARASGT